MLNFFTNINFWSLYLLGDTGRGGSYSDKENYVNLLDELRSEFDKHDWLLSAAVPAPKSRIDPGSYNLLFQLYFCNNQYDLIILSTYILTYNMI